VGGPGAPFNGTDIPGFTAVAQRGSGSGGGTHNYSGTGAPAADGIVVIRYIP
jgi:hypothetical protein